MKTILARLGVVAVLFSAVAAAVQDPKPAADPPLEVAPGVWMQRHHDIGKYGSNVGWIEFKDWVVVIDTAFPFGAEAAMKSIKATTKNKPVRYAVLTHYHGDHSAGSGVFAAEGATIVAHETARRDFLAKNVEGFARSAERDPLYKKSPPRAPDLTFTDSLVLDDGTRRAELRWFGHAHTPGCIFTFLPKEKVVFTGDACVNGPFNYMGDSDLRSWIGVLGQVQALGAEQVVPGHGAAGGPGVLVEQKRYLAELREAVGKLAADGKSLEEVKAAVDLPAWKAWTGESKMNLSNIEHAWREAKGN